MSYSFREITAPPASAGYFWTYSNALQSAWQRAMRPAWVVLIACALLLALLCAVTKFEFAPWTTILWQVISQALVLAAVVYFVHIGQLRIAVAFEAIALFTSTVLIVPPLESVLAAAAFPYVDGALVAADRVIGIDWLAMAVWFRDHPDLTKVLSHSYASIEWQPLVLIFALSWIDPERLRRVLTTSIAALAVTLVIFLVAPAIGPYAYFGYTSADFPSVIVPAAWIAPGITESLREGSHQFFHAGLVTFPSYHAVVAVLFAYGWLAVPVLRWLFVPLNLVMLVSTVPIGSHYVTDVVVGVAITAICYRMVDRYFRATDGCPPIPRWSQAESRRARDFLARALAVQ